MPTAISSFASCCFGGLLALASALPGGATPAERSAGLEAGRSGVEQMQDRESAVVVLDVFSGTPNPTWSLGTEQTRALSSRLASLAPAPTTLPESSRREHSGPR
jgi:hypothetical protein